jgi:hypothetical protein
MWDQLMRRLTAPVRTSIDELHDLPHLDQKECQRRTQRQGEQKFPNPVHSLDRRGPPLICNPLIANKRADARIEAATT